MSRTAHGPTLHADGTVTFRVWAPFASLVELDLRGTRHRLSAAGRGWYVTRLPARPGDRYGYALDGGPLRPDPASRRQPDGVHRASALVHTDAFPWSPEESRWRPPPLGSGAIYELHVGAFTTEGTFAAARAQLPALRALGISHVEVMPVAAFDGPRGWGYDGVCWYAVHESYGGPTQFAAFVDACHQQGLAVILDVVYNHFGPSGSYHREFGPYLTARHRAPWGPAINLDDAGSDAVREFIVGNALLWLLDYHVDGLRLDAVHALLDTSAPPLLAALSRKVELASELRGRELILIAESNRADPRLLRSRDAGALGIHGQWLDDLHHAIHVTVTGEQDGYYADHGGLADVATAYERGFVYQGRWSAYRGRTVGAPLPEQVSSRRLVACVQNHDQIGNRARAERLTTLCDPALVRVAIALLCLAPTTPLMFMGEEYGETKPFLFFTSHPEPEVGETVRSGRREEFAGFAGFAGELPDPQDEASYSASVLDRRRAHSATSEQCRALWADLLRLRRTQPALATGDRRLVEVLEVRRQVLVLRRAAPVGTEDCLIVANTASHAASVRVTAWGGWELRWSSSAREYGGGGATARVGVPGDGSVTVEIPPRTVLLLGPPSAAA